MLNTICKFQQYIYSYLFNLCSLSSLKIIFLKLWPGLMTFKNKNGFPLYIGFNLLMEINCAAKEFLILNCIGSRICGCGLRIFGAYYENGCSELHGNPGLFQILQDF